MPQDLLDDLAFESQWKNLVISACDFCVYSLSIDLDEKSYVENLDGIKNLLDWCTDFKNYEANYDEEQGRIVIKYQLFNQEYSFSTEETEYFDVRLFDHINQSLEEVKCEKKIACLKDGWGGYFVYVGTDQQIEEFSKLIN